MKTIFALLDTYEEAKEAVNALMQGGIQVEEMNALVQTQIAKSAMDINLAQAGVAVTDAVGEQRLEGLDRLIAGEQSISLPGLGDMYAAGDVATLMAKAALGRRDEERGLTAAMREFQLPAKMAETYYDGIQGGGWLLFVRTDDDKAKEALPTLRTHSNAVSTVSG